ncbi:outer membrane protein assembly factor BamC [Shewanella avicenniae]|uniref:Outer membrane protein assembly factor BamC n=1 Tax=Shewanella avicenniae TaxID=2814294 RepID=A0ABX7QVK8_9GAMM|nr:outer membrane protein assembly factor BamC [Shewanella avicenniae]QSX35299.1 outer membrane protein assembly factor BamC [Shewanella avicenniae]
MLKLKHLSVVIAVLSVTACSTPIERRQPNGTFDYVKAEKQSPLVIPTGLNTPPYSKEYEIPKVGDKVDNAVYGERLDIRPPQQILPLADGTHVEEGSDEIKIVVESIKGSSDLKQEMLSVVEGFLNKYQYKIASEDKQKGVIQTDWIDSSEVIDSNWFSENQVFDIRQRYQFDIEVRPHGRTGYLKINVIESQQSFNGEEKDKALFLNKDEQERYAISMLNRTISFMSVERENIIRASKVAESKGIAMSFVAAANEDGEGYFVADAPLKRTWDRIALSLPEIGLEVVDMDSAKGVYYLAFKDNSSFWDSFFGGKNMNIKNGNYRLLLKAAEDTSKTEVRFHNASDEKIDAEALKTVYDAIASVVTQDRKTN